MDKYIIYMNRSRVGTAIAESEEIALEMFFKNRMPMIDREKYKAVKLSTPFGSK